MQRGILQVVIGVILLNLGCSSSSDGQLKIEKVIPSEPDSHQTPGEVSPLEASISKNGEEFAGIKLPIYLADEQVFILEIQPIDTNNASLQAGVNWLAMGVPCSNGGGKVDFTGKHYGNPNMIGLIVSNSCPMLPRDRDAFAKSVKNKLGLGEKSKMKAIYPLQLQYWELADFRDRGLGDTIELRTNSSLKKGWKSLSEGGKLSVKMYGRENGWMSHYHLYYIEATVKLVARKRFALTITSARQLKSNEIADAKKRCEEGIDESACEKVFTEFLESQ